MISFSTIFIVTITMYGGEVGHVTGEARQVSRDGRELLILPGHISLAPLLIIVCLFVRRCKSKDRQLKGIQKKKKKQTMLYETLQSKLEIEGSELHKNGDVLRYTQWVVKSIHHPRFYAINYIFQKKIL